jgi:TonB-dependent starch-binding outer membrane protein SusC
MKVCVNRSLLAVLCSVTACTGSLLGQTTTRDSAMHAAARESLTVRQLTRVRGTTLHAAPSFTLEQALQGKLPGVVVSMNDGAPWSDGQIQIRGISTVVGDPSPLIVVDGAIVTNSFLSEGAYDLGSFANNLRAPSSPRLRDFTPFEIETVEVLQGPVATSRYGSRGAPGVLLITTKRGNTGALHWNATQRAGQLTATRLPSPRCYGSVDDVATQGPFYRTLAAAASAENGGTLACRDYVRTYYGRQPVALESGLQASGSIASTRFMASLARASTPDATEASTMTRTNLRLNLDRRVTDRFSAQLSVGYAPSALQQAYGSATALDAFARIPSWVPLAPDDPSAALSRTFFEPFRLRKLGTDFGFARGTTGSLRLVYDLVTRPSTSIQLSYLGAMDRNGARDSSDFAFDTAFVYAGQSDLPGRYMTRSDIAGAVSNHELRLAIGARARRLGDATFETGYIHDRQSLNSEFGNSGGTFRTLSANRRTNALYATSTLSSLRDRLILTASVRRDAFNRETMVRGVYPSASAAWRVTLPAGRGVVTPRIAWGRSGGLGPFGRVFAVIVPEDGGFGLGVQQNGSGSAQRNVLELRTDGEVGVDVSLGHGAFAASLMRVASDAEHLGSPYTSATRADPIVPFYGDAISLKTIGYDIALRGRIGLAHGAYWMPAMTFLRSRSTVARVSSASRLAAATKIPVPNGYVRLNEGRSATALTTVSSGISNDVFGDGAPLFDATFSNSLVLGPVSLSAQLDWRRGGDLVSASLFRRDLFRTSADFADKSSQAGVQLGQARLNDTESFRSYLTTGTALRLREVVLRYALPQSLTNRLFHANSLGISLQARNLALWTKSIATDPEFSGLGTNPVARYLDYARYPLLRQLYIGVDLGK